jgi:hypothetical protein
MMKTKILIIFSNLIKLKGKEQELLAKIIKLKIRNKIKLPFFLNIH